jgi:hypothetical protein
MMYFKYDSWKYLYPPRPEAAIAPEMLQVYQNMGWVAQFKKNGTCGIMGISPGKEFVSMNRHFEVHKTWPLPDHLKTELTRLFPEQQWFVLVLEVMHLKGPSIKNTIYIHDMVVWMSEYLVGSKFIERQEILDNRLITNVETKTHYVCDEGGKVWYAKRFDKGFSDLFWSIKNVKIDEGLVLKDPNGKLISCDKPEANRVWQVKCRHPHANYSF